MKPNTKQIGERIRTNIHQVDPEADVILYGSRARGNERKDSDWDILVLTNDAIDINRERLFRNNLYDLELETGEPFSLFVYSKTDWFSRQRITPFFQNVTREGIKL